MRILVVDDERAIADYVARFLGLRGYHALPLYSPEDALEHLKMLRFDVALIGIVMPGLDGLELGDRVRELAPECRIVLFDVCTTVEACRSHRSDFEYLATPFEAEDLLSILAS